MPRETSVGCTSIGPDREGSENSRTNASPYSPNSKTSCRGKMFCLLRLVEENDQTIAEACMKNEDLVLETWSGGHDISCEYCHKYFVHDSFENLQAVDWIGYFSNDFLGIIRRQSSLDATVFL